MSDPGLERWHGRVAMVTGASSGIGRSVALELARSGMRLVGCARRHDRLAELEAELDGAPCLMLPCDLRDEAQIARMFARVREEWGGVDVLVNSAGLGHDAPLLSGTTEAWRETLDVNVLALAVCTREAIADMRRRGDDGHVIHISSMSGHRVPAGSAMYAASKYAVRALTEALRQELHQIESGIRVSAVSPGTVETEFAARCHQSQEVARELYGRFEVMKPADVARIVRFILASPPHLQVHDVLVRAHEQPE